MTDDIKKKDRMIRDKLVTTIERWANEFRKDNKTQAADFYEELAVMIKKCKSRNLAADAVIYLALSLGHEGAHPIIREFNTRVMMYFDGDFDDVFKLPDEVTLQ